MNARPTVLMTSAFGRVAFEIALDAVPQCGSYILNHVKKGTFGEQNRSSIYRLLNSIEHAQEYSEYKIDIVQFGIAQSWETEADFPEFCKAHETTRDSGLTHKRGTVSMARSELGTNCTELFICIKDAPELDFAGHRHDDGHGFVAIGQVVEGMDVIDRLWEAASAEEFLPDPIPITLQMGGTQDDQGEADMQRHEDRDD
jgi:peptidyl-prolyl cis-trans isomerase A (cyclophilin A)